MRVCCYKDVVMRTFIFLTAYGIHSYPRMPHDNLSFRACLTSQVGMISSV
jgi:hypothetical protein